MGQEINQKLKRMTTKFLLGGHSSQKRQRYPVTGAVWRTEELKAHFGN